MNGLAYYNEFDPKAAAWLRELIRAGHIANGVVDERSIVDVRAEELRDYTQCHFFAGIGGCSRALRLVGVSDNERRDTGSCPCQPFSDAGKGMGEADPRHLWPAWFRIIRERRPATIYGEQVASKAALRWWDGVSADLESEGYATVAFDLCAAGVGAPTIRQRLFWVAHARCECDESGGISGKFPEQAGFAEEEARQRKRGRDAVADCLSVDRMAAADGPQSGDRELQRGGEHGQRAKDGGAGGVAVSDRRERDGLSDGKGRFYDGPTPGRIEGNGQSPACSGSSLIVPRGSGFVVPFDRMADTIGQRGCGGQAWCEDASDARKPSEDGGFWSRFDLCLCTDGKARRIEPGSFPLVTGLPGRVGLLRGYGNAINPEVAAEFIRCAEESITP